MKHLLTVIIALAIVSTTSAVELSISVDLSARQIAVLRVLCAEHNRHLAEQGIAPVSLQEFAKRLMLEPLQDAIRSRRRSAALADEADVALAVADDCNAKAQAIETEAIIRRQVVLDARVAEKVEEKRK